MYPLIPAPDGTDDDEDDKLFNEIRDRLRAHIMAMPDAELEAKMPEFRRIMNERKAYDPDEVEAAKIRVAEWLRLEKRREMH